MKICILGAGVVGVSTAFALSRIGHEVEVIDRGTDVANGASHANGAQLSWSYTNPLASPTILPKLPAYALGLDPAMRVRPSLNPSFIKWGLSFLRNCTSARYEMGGQARHQLAIESQDALASIERDLIDGPIEKTGKGKIVLAQTRAQQRAMKGSPLYKTAEECLSIEPALRSWSKTQLGGLYAPDDSAVNPILFCQRLKNTAESEFGTVFRMGERVLDILTESNRAYGIRTEKAVRRYDKIIVCLGNQSNDLLRPLGITAPICSVRGYSVTLPANEKSPKASLTDLSNKIVFANLGDQVRIAGFADINASDRKSSRRVAKLIKIARQHWPDIADYDADPKAWSGQRPMTPSGIPVIGPTKVEGLLLNVGHGSLGYTFSPGSAQRIADQIGSIQ